MSIYDMVSTRSVQETGQRFCKISIAGGFISGGMQPGSPA